MDKRLCVRLGENLVIICSLTIHFLNEPINKQYRSSFARLNFDYDIRRGSENGPWADLIPIDGRDVWRFTLAYNDQYDDDAWHSIPNSFVNLGRHARNRCWPWTADHVLPYRRTGADAPTWGNGPGGALQVHVDLGPFLEKNVGRKTPQSFQAYAA